MNLFIYNYIADKLSGAIDKGYRKGIAGVVLLNKKEILKLADTPELFKISYTDVDKVALTNFKVEAFTVAGVMAYECEEKLKQLAVELQEGTHPLAKGEKDIKSAWVAEAHNILADYVDMPDMPPPRHLQTNLRTAMQSSYHAAEYIRLQDDSVRDLYPAYQYKTLDDVRVREAHRKLHDMIWANNDPVWDKIWPPNGWNCRCYIKPLNQEETANSNVQPVTPPEKVSDIAREGRIGKGFERNPGQTHSIWGKWRESKLDGLNWSEVFLKVFHVDRSVNKFVNEKEFGSILQQNAAPFREIEFSKENWDKEFPGNKAFTVFGDYAQFKDVNIDKDGKKVKSSQYEKLKEYGREKYLGLIGPTLLTPIMVIRDKYSGMIFLKPFMKKGRIDYSVIVYQEGDLKSVISTHVKERFKELFEQFRDGEVLRFYPSPTQQTGFSMWNTSPKLMPANSDIAKLTTTEITDKFKREIRETKMHADEIWAELYDRNGQSNSKQYFIRYRVDDFEMVNVNNNIPYNYRRVDYTKIDEYRKGVLLYQSIQLPR